MWSLYIFLSFFSASVIWPALPSKGRVAAILVPVFFFPQMDGLLFEIRLWSMLYLHPHADVRRWPMEDTATATLLHSGSGKVAGAVQLAWSGRRTCSLCDTHTEESAFLVLCIQ